MNIKSIFAALFILALSTSVMFGQNVKIGYTNPEYILSLLPKYKQIESDLKSYEKQLQSQLDNKLKEYQTKLEAYQRDLSNNTIPDVVKQDREKELLNMQNNIKDFEENAMASMQKKQNDALDPLIVEVQNAIDAVAQENGYTYVLSTSAGSNAVILYSKNKDEDISELILKKLGVAVPAKTETGTTGTGTGTGTGGGTNTNTGTNTTTAPLKKK